MVCALNRHLIYGAVSPIAKIHRSRKQGVELEMALFAITMNDSIAKFLFPVPVTLFYVVLEVSVPKGGIFPTRRHSNDS